MPESLNFTGTIHTEDLEARKWVSKLDAKIDDVNSRAKANCLRMTEIEKKIKELELKLGLLNAH